MQTVTETHSALKIFEINVNPRHPAITIDDLASMLEIDSVLGRRDDLRRRLQKALDDAFVQGTKFRTHARAMTARVAG